MAITIKGPKVVIVGGGFGGLEAAKRLRKTDVAVTLVDRHNYHLFQPLLYQVATGGLSPANIAAPLRMILSRQKNCDIVLGEVIGIDPERRHILLRDGELHYDHLILAAGSTHSYFGNPQWQNLAPGLKSIGEATEIRRRIFQAFETADRTTDGVLRRRCMTFVIIGGGPTGIELAGALAEISRHTLKHDFRHIQPEDARIVVVEAAEHILSHLPQELSQAAARSVGSLGIEVLTRTKATELQPGLVRLEGPGGETDIETETVLWAAGVQANPLGKAVAQSLHIDVDRGGRIPVDRNLCVAGYENIYVIGDLARCLNIEGQPLPGVAPVAIQQGRFVADRISARVSGKTFELEFNYHDPGTMATIGRSAAVARIGNRHYHGWIAWLLWLIVHLRQIVLFQNRLLILFQWIWGYLTFNRSARLIIDDDSAVLSPPPALKAKSEAR